MIGSRTEFLELREKESFKDYELEHEFLQSTIQTQTQKTNKMITKIKSVQGSGSFQSKHGLLYKFEYLFEDGVCLIANHKTQTSPFKAGDEVEYIIIRENEYGKQGTVKKPEQQNNPNQSTYHKTDIDSSSQMTKEDWRKKDIAIIYQNAFTQSNSFHEITGFTDKYDVLTQLCSTADAIAKFVILKSGI